MARKDGLLGLLGPKLTRSTVDCASILAEDLDLEFSPEPPLAASPSGTATGLDEGTSIVTAVQEQLGLKLESERGPVEFLVIDSIEQSTPD